METDNIIFEVEAYLTVNNHGPALQKAWYGWVLECMDRKGNPVTREGFGELRGTTNAINIKALGIMAGRLKKPCRVCLHTNNRHLEAAIANGWLKEWSKNSWKNSSGKEIKNKELWSEAWEYLSPHTLTAKYEPKHIYNSWILTEIKKKKEGNDNGSNVSQNST